MISGSARRDDDRAFRIAIVASVVVHVTIVVLALFANRAFARLLVPATHDRHPRPQDEIVTVSSALRFERRARPVPATRRVVAGRPHAVPVRPAPAVRPQVAARPLPVAPPLARPAEPAIEPPTYAPPKITRELYRPSVRATPLPPVRAAEAPAAPPRPTAPAVARRPQPAQAFSPERLAQIERDLAKTIAQTRPNIDPVRSLARQLPAAPKRYRVQMQGRSETLHHGEGTYTPIKAWHASGLDWYYVSYEFVYADGTYETGSVPWPIHFSPDADPFERGDPTLAGKTPLPPPPPGYLPPGTLGKALRVYFPNLRFED